MDRAAAVRVRNAISAYNPMTTYQVEGSTLYVAVPGGLIPEQRELIKTHKPELVALLTTPPEQSGTCIHGHTLVWKCNKYGLWVCICYFTGQIAPASMPEPEPATLQNYWTQVKEGNIPLLPSSFKQKVGSN